MKCSSMVVNWNLQGYPEAMETPPPDPRIPPLLSAQQAADELDITRQAVVRAAKNGRIAGRLVGGTWVFRAELVALLKKQKDKAGASQPLRS